MRPAIEYAQQKFIDSGPLTVAEIGVGDGDHAQEIIDALGPTLALYLIDSWRAYPGYGIDAGDVWEERFGAVCDRFENGAGVVIARAFSTDAAQCIIDGFLDLVYIDANHEYRAVAIDIDAWWPKVKPGGILCGHAYDMNHPGVVEAVDQFAAKHTLDLHTQQSDWWVDKPVTLARHQKRRA